MFGNRVDIDGIAEDKSGVAGQALGGVSTHGRRRKRGWMNFVSKDG